LPISDDGKTCKRYEKYLLVKFLKGRYYAKLHLDFLVGNSECQFYAESRINLFGTKEFDGLKVMMILISNWDLKGINNIILEHNGNPKYYVSDLGACFGKTGVERFGRSKNNIKDFSRSKFIKKVSEEKVDFLFHTRPLFFFIFYPFYYFDRASVGKIAKDIPKNHVKWIGGRLSKLSDKQLNDAFRAANYSPDQAQKFVLVLRNRINLLTKL
jgi:hypothetical protein